MRLTRWHTSPLPFDKTRKLADSLGISEITATILARRGYADPEAARRFLDVEGDLHDPFLFPDMPAVCERLKQALASGEKICVHGDYDVDGITAAALIVSILKGLGGRVTHHLPNRFSEGYGISPGAVKKIAAAGNSLLVTVDCGIGAREQIELARSLGLETIVIDHHRPIEESLPPAMIISPLMCEYPFKDLAGVGLAFKVAQALLGEPGMHGKLPEQLSAQLDLVALGTIADVVPLIGENRSLVKRGLIHMARGHRPGLKALMEIGQVEPLKLSAGMVAFRLAPRINAAGRLDDPEIAFELLMAEDTTSAAKLARQLDALNQERQKIENRMLAGAQEMVSGWPGELRNSNGYVLNSPGWHEGVIGIVASRMVDLHHRPVIMIAEGDEHGKGSGRSIPAFDLHGALLELGHLLKAYGGHSAACGLTIERGNIDDFRECFARYADETITEDDLQRVCRVDAVVTGRELTLGLAEELNRLEPFGLGNPQVDLLATGVQLHGGRTTRNGMHLQCQVDCGGVRSSAIAFRQAFLLDQVSSDRSWDVVFRLEQNEFNGSVSPQLNLRDLIPRTAEPATPTSSCSWLCDFDCEDRVQGEEFWSLLTDTPESAFSLETLAMEPEYAASALPEHHGRLIDRRGYGSIPGQITRIASTGQSLLLLVADVPRRRHLITNNLPLSNLRLEKVLIAGSRCRESAVESRLQELEESVPALVMADFSTALKATLPSHFDHVVFVDPPPHGSIFNAIAACAPKAWLHLFYCDDEVQFTGKIIEHEYDVRAPMTKVYKKLRTANVRPLDEATERLLLSGGKYLRQPTMVARCLKILEELSLISIEEKAGKPILTLLETGKTDLSRSPTYRAAQSFYEGCQKFLNKSLKMALT